MDVVFDRRWPLERLAGVVKWELSAPGGNEPSQDACMRILYVMTENLNRSGGGIVHFLAVARNLKKLGHHVVIMGPQYSTVMNRRSDLEGIYLPVPGRNGVSLLIFEFWSAVLFPFIMLIHRPEALLVRGGGLGAGWLILLAARLFGVAAVLEVNGVAWEEWRSRGYPWPVVWLARWCAVLQCRAANRVISVTGGICDELARASGIPADRVFAIANGADPEGFDRSGRQRTREALGIGPDDFVVGFTGLFGPWHGVLELVGSAECLEPSVRKHVRYVLVGNGVMYSQARRMVRDAKLEKNVLMPGWATREQIKDYLAAFDVGVFITTDERKKRFACAPLKVFEYLAASLPVIVTADSHLTPMVEGHKMGLLIDTATPSSIAAAVTEAYRRRDEFADIGRRNRQLVFDEFSWLHVARKVARVLSGDGMSTR